MTLRLPLLPAWVRWAAVVVGAVVGYGVGIEFGQSFVPRRYFSVGDAAANAVGGLLVAPWYLLRPRVGFVGLGEYLGR